MVYSIPKITALMPMRHRSERVEGKNYRPFGDGRALFEHALSALLDCRYIDKVIINTDSPAVNAICREKYQTVVIHDRPVDLQDGNISMNEIIMNDLSRVSGDYFFQTHSTNPLLDAKKIEEAIEMFFANVKLYDSLFSVTKLQSRLWDELARPLNHNKYVLIRTQDLPPLYEENSCFYIFHRKTFEQSGRRIGDRPCLFELSKVEATDIDTEADFIIAEQLFKVTKK